MTEQVTGRLQRIVARYAFPLVFAFQRLQLRVGNQE